MALAQRRGQAPDRIAATAGCGRGPRGAQGGFAWRGSAVGSLSLRRVSLITPLLPAIEALTRIRTYGGDVSMRFIRECLMAASYVLVFLGSAQAQSVTIGERRAVGRRLPERQSSVGPNAQARPDRNHPEPVLLCHRRERKPDPRASMTPPAPTAGPARSKPRPPALPQRQAGIRPRSSRLSHWPPATTGWPICQAAMLLVS